MTNKDLGPAMLPIDQSTFPHMLSLDTMVWRAFLQGDHPKITKVWYDVKVGKPIDTPPNASPSLLAIAEGTGAKRIDVVALVGNTLWIIELKPYANHAALGQVILYRTLFRQKYGTKTPTLATIICDHADEDVVAIAATMDIQIIETTQWIFFPETPSMVEPGPIQIGSSVDVD